MTITVHHLETSQSFRIVWLMEELGINYELKNYKRLPNKMAPPEYQALSPLDTAPVITDGDLVLCESNAIIDYILDNAGTSKMRPAVGSPYRTDYLFWYHAAQGTLMLNMSMDSMMRIIPTRFPFPLSYLVKFICSKVLSQRVEPRLRIYLNLAEQQLTKYDYFAGNELTAADITSIYPMDAAFTRYPHFNDMYPKCRAWLERMPTRAAYKKAVEKTGDATVSSQL